MSVRHQVRAYVERLFEGLKERVGAGEYTVYCIYSPKEETDIEEFDFVDIKVNMEDPESVKKFLDRVTREALENEVKGLYLLGMVLEKEGEYVWSSEDPKAENLKEEIIERIESLKEE